MEDYLIGMYKRYMSGVSAGTIVSGHFTKMAVQRHLNDLKKSEGFGYPYLFLVDMAARHVSFLCQLKYPATHYPSKKGNHIELDMAQIWRLMVLFGWHTKYPFSRRFQRAFIGMGRRNAEQLEVEMLAVHGLANFTNVPQCSILLAQNNSYASVIYSGAASMAKEMWPGSKMNRQVFRAEVNNSTRELFFISEKSRFIDGLSPNFIGIEGFHQFKSDKSLKTLELGAVTASYDPLTYIVSSAGASIQSPCGKEWERCRGILDGKTVDDKTFCVLYEIDEGDDWQNPQVWAKANPALYLDQGFAAIAHEYSLAKKHNKFETFKSQRLNIWQN